MKWIDSRDWEEAFWAVIPKRKFQGELRDQAQSGGEKDAIAEQDEDGRHDSDTDDGEAMHTHGETEDSEIKISQRGEFNALRVDVKGSTDQNIIV